MRRIILGVLVASMVGTITDLSAVSAVPPTAREKPEAPESGKTDFDGDRAFGYLKKICDLGPRISGSREMEKQQKLLAEHFAALKAQVRYQSFDAPDPQTRKPVRMNNLIVSWDREAKERVLIACHYDTRPLADRDPDPQLAQSPGFLGANDGASGVALLMEMGNHIREVKPTYGVDFIFFDGEELVYQPRDPYFLGSEYFAKQYRDSPPPYKYVYGVVVDMIGDKDLQVYYERNSLLYAPELTRSIWKTARRLGVREFISREGHEIRDDHLALNEIAGIHSCDLIDFDYPHWHTMKDVPASCSGKSLASVGSVLLAWLEEVPAAPLPPKSKKKQKR